MTKKEKAPAAEKPAEAKAAPMPIKAPAGPVEARGRVYEHIFETIGATPLVRIKKFTEKHKLEMDLLAKLESFNPLSSVKDRTCLAMIENAEREGKITPGKTVLMEATAGNAGISLAMIAAVKGYRFIAVMPESVSLDYRKMLRLFGAEIVLTPVEYGTKGSLERLAAMKEKEADVFVVNQFENQAGLMAHAHVTAEEIWKDTGGKVDILVAGVGTGATITGIAKALKAKNPAFKAYAVEPELSAVLSKGVVMQHKIQGIGAGFVPPLLDKAAVDGVVKITDDEAMNTAREIAKLEGIPCGISSGAALAAAIKVARIPESKGKTAVVFLPSGAERYIASQLFNSVE